MEHNPVLKNPLSLDSEIPLYSQLMGIIKRSITSGALKVGDLLPSEAELCRVYDISRNTVRQAIGALEEEGFVVRKRGKGTFVTDPNTRRKGVQYSFTTEISQLGKTPSSTLVDFAVITPSPKIVTLMGLEPGVKVYRFTRVRNVDGEPLILETSYYPEYIYPNLTRELLETHSFYSCLLYTSTSCSACRSTRPQPPMRCATITSRTSSPSRWIPPSSPRARTTISLTRRRSTRRSSPRRRRVKSQRGALYGCLLYTSGILAQAAACSFSAATKRARKTSGAFWKSGTSARSST